MQEHVMEFVEFLILAKHVRGLLRICCMWDFQERLLVTKTPRYLNPTTSEIFSFNIDTDTSITLYTYRRYMYLETARLWV